MNLLSPNWSPAPATLQRGGTALLWVALGLGIVVVLAVAWKAYELLPLLPVLLIGGVGVFYLLRHPLLHLCVTLLASALILQHKPDIQIEEVLYGLYSFFFLGTWFFNEVVLKRTPIFASLESRLLLGFLLYVGALVPLSFIYGATPYTVVRELHALVMVAFFFPIREACARYRSGTKALLLVGAALTLIVVVRNLFLYQSALQNSDQLIGVVQGRVIANDHVLCAASLFTFVFLLHATSLRRVLTFLGLFLVSFSGLLLTLGRAFWLSFALGVAFLFITVERKQRVRILLFGSSAAVPLIVVGVVFFGDYVSLFFQGLLERLTSVGGAMSTDISFLGRLTEAQGALERISENPVLGHGVGVPFEYRNIILHSNVQTTFAHIGYLYIWYAFGLLGSALVLAWWWRSFWCGVKSYLLRDAPLTLRLGGLAAAATIVAFTLSASTSNPFWHKDYLLGLAFVMGIACGARARAEISQSPVLSST